VHKTTSAAFSRLLASSSAQASFRLFYVCSIGAALGYTMQAAIAAWLMATLTPSALAGADGEYGADAVFGLVARALADTSIAAGSSSSQVVLFTAAVILGAATSPESAPFRALACTFLFGAGFTFYLPQQASVNELVSRAELPGQSR
jgi:hypothetical protein